jgi:hypothetical protein
MKKTHVPILFGSVMALAAGSADPPRPELPLVAEESFEAGADRWEPTDAGAWKVIDTDRGKVYSLFRQSKYSPPHRSPVNFSLLRDVQVSDFVLDAKVLSTVKDYGHRDMCVVFGYRDPAHFYYVHFGKKTDDHANQIFIVNGAPRVKISTATSPGTNWDDAWHDVRITRRGDGAIQVFFDDLKAPVMVARDHTFPAGRIGLGSFDDTGNWDEVKLRGTKVSP